ncbi:hypothetical protein OIDMADRAFT_107109 [Oidiodendron maius Zn]|uniref:Cytochrome P450 n=1 Tax=Oidiodendron maius (strain Zn) TaxID=913774 RepID=A0A0C3GPR9_OIDMZ|nr:hypothetical protein OIDMADRAFT_107109 [Oidiodendron maius Zn]
MYHVSINNVRYLGIALVTLLVYRAHQTLKKPSSKVPGPWYSKWTSLILKYHWLSGTRSFYVQALHQEYGPVVRIAPDYVDFCDIDATKTIYSAKETFRKSAWYSDFVPVEEQNIFSTRDIDFHRRHRRLLGGPMSESSLKSMIPLVNARIELAITKMRDEMTTRGAADIYKWWIFMATDVIGELTFGDSFHMLELGKKNEYIRDIEKAALIGALFSTFPCLARVAVFLPLPIIKTAATAARNIRVYSLEYVRRYSQLLDENPDRVQQTLFTKLFQAGEEGKLTFDEIVNDSLSYILGGSDSTALSLTYLIWYVCRDPEIQTALVKELRTLPSDFTESDLRELPYLGHVIDETLRLYAAAPSGLPREVPCGGAEISGYWLNEGITVCSQAYSMHRDPKIFPDPDKFDPSRWVSPTKVMNDASMPFGKGARSCLGLHLAMIELRLATARFFIEFPDATGSTLEGMSDADMVPKIYFLIHPTGGRCLIQKSEVL